MNLTQLIPKNLTSLSIIGLSKNAGKTTVFNAVIQALKEQLTLGIVSSGVDGEEHDVWSHRKKPRVVIPKGALVATAGLFLDEHPGDWEILAAAGVETVSGHLLIAKAVRETTVKLIGVSAAAQIQQIQRHFIERGVQLTLVDGAYDRKAVASPTVTEAALLVVGASMDVSLDRVLPKVEELIHAFTRPVTQHVNAGQQAKSIKQVVVFQDEEMEILPVSSLFQMKSFLELVQKKNITYLAVPGAITDSMIRGLIEAKRFFTFIIPDATHLFASLPLLRQFYRKGGAIEVLSPIQLIGVAINPTSPEGYAFPSAVMKKEIASICTPIPVFDVVKEGV